MVRGARQLSAKPLGSGSDFEVEVAALAKLKSNRGGESLRLEFIERRDCGPDLGADCNVILAGSNWSEGEPKTVRADLGRLHISLVAVSALAADLERWVGLPLDQLATEPLECEHEIAFTPTSELRLRFGERSDAISDRKPVLTTAFSVGSFKGELHFVTDQSCIAEFVAGLRQAERAIAHEWAAAQQGAAADRQGPRSDPPR
jgi:hypothetical protein